MRFSAILCVLLPVTQSFHTSSKLVAGTGRLSRSFQQDPFKTHTVHKVSVRSDDQKSTTYTEESRKYRRTVFKHEDWVRHREPDRIFRNLLSTFDSGVVRQLGTEVLFVTLTALFAVTWNAVMYEGYYDFSGIHHDPITFALLGVTEPISFLKFSISQVPFSLSSPALGLLLVFRTNASYSRWWEARQRWGTIINHTRNIVRQGAAWSGYDNGPMQQTGLLNSVENNMVDDMDPEERQRIYNKFALSVWAFSRSLQRHLSDPAEEVDFDREIRATLDADQADALIASPHRPTRALFDMSMTSKDLPLDYFGKYQLDKSITVLGDMCGSCERIYTSPVPLVYTRHTARFLSAWLILLPFALWEPFKDSWNHLAAIPAAGLISIFFFGIEELAIQLEEPFSILPMQGFNDGIKARTEDAIGWYAECCKTVQAKPKHSIEAKAKEKVVEMKDWSIGSYRR